jgi:hypothetical protein
MFTAFTAFDAAMPWVPNVVHDVTSDLWFHSDVFSWIPMGLRFPLYQTISMVTSKI